MTEALPSMRREIRSARRALEPIERAIFDEAIVGRLFELISQRKARRVASYLSTDGEPDLDALHESCHDAGVEVAVPVMGPDTTLEFRLLSGALERNRSGILEPRHSVAVPLSTIDIVLVPLVVFDDAGNRAGRGGGWYDRALADAGAGQLLIGVAYELQQRPEVPTHAEDVPLHAVVTEQRLVMPTGTRSSDGQDP